MVEELELNIKLSMIDYVRSSIGANVQVDSITYPITYLGEYPNDYQNIQNTTISIVNTNTDTVVNHALGNEYMFNQTYSLHIMAIGGELPKINDYIRDKLKAQIRVLFHKPGYGLQVFDLNDYGEVATPTIGRINTVDVRGIPVGNTGLLEHERHKARIDVEIYTRYK